MQNDLFQQVDGGPIPTSPLQLNLKLVEKKTVACAYRRWHYFGNKGFLASYNFGVYFDNRLFGGISFGIPNAPNISGIYTQQTQSQFLELTRLALSDKCPKNSESRVISIAIKIVSRLVPTLRGIITYADTAYGHTGVIYKASNFRYVGLTAQKTDLFLNGKPVGKIKGLRYRDIGGEWRVRSRKHLFLRYIQ